MNVLDSTENEGRIEAQRADAIRKMAIAAVVERLIQLELAHFRYRLDPVFARMESMLPTQRSPSKHLLEKALDIERATEHAAK